MSSEYNVDGFPTFFLFVDGKPINFIGERTFRGFLRFVRRLFIYFISIRNVRDKDYYSIKSSNDLKKLESLDDSIIGFVETEDCF